MIGRTLLAALFCALFMAAAPVTEKPNVLLVTIDTWRTDYISASGSAKVKTPFLDRMAAEGLYIPKVETPAPSTTPGHASILTGLYPRNHEIRDNIHFRLKAGARTIAEDFRDRGYRTVAVVSGAPLKKIYGLSKGFDIYDDSGFGVEGEDAIVPASRDGSESARKALEYSSRNEGRSLFIWLHLYDPHMPYMPPREFAEMYPRDLYAGEVAYCDSILGGFVRKLLETKKGRWIVVITGDHGEGLGDRGESTHSILLYKETREVPLIIWDSAGRPAKPFRRQHSLIDIYPTIAAISSLAPRPCDGISIFSTGSERWLYSESLIPTMNFGLNPAFSAQKNGKIFIKHGTSDELYSDGDERNDTARSDPAFARLAGGEIKRFFGENNSYSSNLKLSAEEMRTLASLGYLGSATQDVFRSSPCDLRAFAADFSDTITSARAENARGNFAAALRLYDRAVKKYGGSAILRLERGSVLVGLNRFDEARAEFLECLKLDRNNSVAMLNLGNIMMMKGKQPEAEKLYLSSLAAEEQQPEAHLNLGILYSKKPEKRQDAVRHLGRFLELAPPGDPDAKNVADLIRKLGGVPKP